MADVNAGLLPLLDAGFAIDGYTADTARDFLWRHRRQPYDLTVYQLGNAAAHDFVWAYLAHVPGLVVLHDPRLHHARARLLLQSGRFDDYRREFRYDHPDAVADFAEYAVAGLGGPIYYQWPMLRAVMRSARLVAVHNARVAADLREQYPGVLVDAIRLGTAAPGRGGAPSTELDAARVFIVFGKITAEKRISAIVRAFGRMAADADVHLVVAGDASDYAPLGAELAPLPAGRVHVVGHAGDDEVREYLAASDVCLCLRWPTALESSASWLQCLALGRATITSDLAHLVDVPTLDARSGRASHASAAPVAVRVDLLDEDAALLAAMRRLAGDDRLRGAIGDAGRAYWAENHTLDAMADDYRRVIAAAAGMPSPRADDLPAHFVDDHSRTLRTILARFGLEHEMGGTSTRRA